MFTRCYNDNYHNSKPDYAECTICKEWLDDKKRFYQWVDDNFYIIEGEPTVQLDKDIRVQGNKCYSPDTCVFAPPRINDMFSGSSKKNKKGLPTGVSYSEKTGKYTASISKDGRNVKLGSYNTVEEAIEVYKEHKKAEIVSVADSYKDMIPEVLYNAMLAWDVMIEQ